MMQSLRNNTQIILAGMLMLAIVSGMGVMPGVAAASHSYHNDPSCWISASPSTISYGGNTLLSWGSTDADDAWISDIGDVPVNGTRSVWDITSTKTYTLTVQNDHGTKTCSTTVYVGGSNSGLSCSIYANKNHVQSGTAVTLNWNSSNAQSAYLSADGSVSPNGSYTVYPYNTTTYTLTVYGHSGQSNQCQTTVYVSGTGYYPPYNYNNYYQQPSCTIRVSNYHYGSSYAYNQTAQLSWSSTNATNAYISPTIGSVATNGVQTLYYQDINKQYTLTVHGPGGTSSCSTTGYTYNQYPQYTNYNYTTPFVYLSQIPYTGLDLGPVGTAVYFLALAAFAVAGGYLVVYYNGGMLRFSFAREVKVAMRNQARTVRNIFSK